MASVLILRLLLLGLFSSSNAWALNDPTRPTDAALFFGNTNTPITDNLTLQSILLAPERRIAVINGKRLLEGDRIGSARVMRIEDSQVLLETSRGMRTLRLLPHTLKR